MDIVTYHELGIEARGEGTVHEVCDPTTPTIPLAGVESKQEYNCKGLERKRKKVLESERERVIDINREKIEKGRERGRERERELKKKKNRK